MDEIFTIGHSSHATETFLGLLRRHEISALADVRSVPYSHRHPQFRRETLAQALRAADIAYVFLGDALGGKRPGSSLTAIAATPEFRAGLERLRDGARRHRAAFMCAEREPLDCHRTILIARHLRGPDLRIRHILADGGIEDHDVTEHRLVERAGTAPLPLLGHDPAAWRDAVEQAYDKTSAAWGAPRA